MHKASKLSEYLFVVLWKILCLLRLSARLRIRPLIIIDSTNTYIGIFFPHFTVSLS